MSVEACAKLVEQADEPRFRAAMAAPVAARRVLFPLYAFNVEVTRAPWVTQEPMIAEMRLQWWRDALEEIAAGKARKHEVVDALAQVLDKDACATLDKLIAARRWDCYKDAFEDDAHLNDYIDATSGGLIWTAARLLGAASEPVVRDFAYASGVAGLLRAVPELETRGRIPLIDGSHAGVKALAQSAMERWKRAKSARKMVSKAAAPALVAGFQARPILQNAIKSPQSVAAGDLNTSPLRFTSVSLRGWWT
jgi:phytoene/squalene synthetase